MYHTSVFLKQTKNPKSRQYVLVGICSNDAQKKFSPKYHCVIFTLEVHKSLNFQCHTVILFSKFLV